MTTTPAPTLPDTVPPPLYPPGARVTWTAIRGDDTPVHRTGTVLASPMRRFTLVHVDGGHLGAARTEVPTMALAWLLNQQPPERAAH